MKKFICAIIVILLVGCGGRRVTCTIEHQDVGGSVTMIMEGRLQGHYVIEYNSRIIFNFDNEQLAIDAYALFQDEDTRGITYTRRGRRLTAETTATFEEAITREEFVRTLEADGFVCR